MSTRFHLRPAHRSTLVAPLPFASVLVCSLALFFGGCAKTHEKPAASPLMEAKKDARLDQTDEPALDVERPHLAPPPAYGNKVVMATRDPNGATF